MQTQASGAKKLSDEAEKSRWRMACRWEKIDRDSEEKCQRILVKEIIKGLPSKIAKAAKEGKTALRFASVPYHVNLPGIIELNILNISSIKKYFRSRYNNSRILENRRNYFLILAERKNNIFFCDNSVYWSLPDNDGVLMARIVSLWLLRNGFKVRIERERSNLGNTTRRWLVAIW